MAEYSIDKDKLEEYEKVIANELRGWVSLEELKHVLPTINNYEISEVKEFVNNRDKIQIKNTNGTATESTYFIKHKTDSPYKKWKDQIPETTHETFDEWVGKGYAPRVVASIITFLTDESATTMVGVANEYDCCAASISNNKTKMAEDLRKKGVKVYP